MQMCLLIQTGGARATGYLRQKQDCLETDVLLGSREAPAALLTFLFQGFL